jgi:hypothetical protein
METVSLARLKETIVVIFPARRVFRQAGRDVSLSYATCSSALLQRQSTDLGFKPRFARSLAAYFCGFLSILALFVPVVFGMVRSMTSNITMRTAHPLRMQAPTIG